MRLEMTNEREGRPTSSATKKEIFTSHVIDSFVLQMVVRAFFCPYYRGHVLYLRHKICVRADFLKAKLLGFLAIDHVTQKNCSNSDLLKLMSE
jgi:hypothetical protein